LLVIWREGLGISYVLCFLFDFLFILGSSIDGTITSNQTMWY
jgi:hypothetical protein